MLRKHERKIEQRLEEEMAVAQEEVEQDMIVKVEAALRFDQTSPFMKAG
jgi:hypothetical protein